MVSNALKLINITGVVLLCMGAPAHSSGSLFGTIASTVSYTDNPAIFNNTGSSIVNQFIINGTYDITDDVVFRGALNTINPTGRSYYTQIDYATFSYDMPQFIPNNVSTLRVGRVKYDIGILENKRNNLQSRYSIHLPFSSYWPAFDTLAQSIDGIQIDTTQHTSIGSISASVTYGKGVLNSEYDDQIFFGYFHTNLNGTLSMSQPIQSVTLKYQTNNFTAQLNHTKLQIDRDFDPTITTPSLLPFDMTIKHQFYTGGVRYNDGDFFTTAEVTLHDFETKPVGFFVKAGKMISPNTRIAFGYSKFTHLSSTPSPMSVPDYKRRGEEHTIGITRYFKDITVKAEYHKGKGTIWFPFDTTDPTWDLLSVSVVYHFNLL